MNLAGLSVIDPGEAHGHVRLTGDDADLESLQCRRGLDGGASSVLNVAR